MDRRFKPWPDRYWAKVEIRGGNECWPWLGPPDAWGYGRISPAGTMHTSTLAHVAALEMHLGRRLLPGMKSCHHCDYPACQNPRHLYEGTDATNAKDMVTRGRYNNGYTIRTVTEDEQQLILSSSLSSRALASQLGFTHRTIQVIRRKHAASAVE